MSGPAGSPRVLHLAEVFVRPSEAWLYDVVTLPSGWQPEVVCESRESPGAFPFDGVHAILPPPRRLGPEWWTRQLNRRARLPVAPANGWRAMLRSVEVDAEVVHAHFGPTGWRAVDAGMSPVVTSFYGYDATDRDVLSYWGRRYPSLFAAGALFVAEGPAMADRLRSIGAPRDRVRVLPLLADTDLRWRQPTPRPVTRIVMPGRFVEKKGFEIGIAAFAAAFDRSDAQLTLIGSGPREPALRALVADLGVADRVQFVPFQGRDQYRRLLEGSDVLLQPSVTAANGDSEGGAPTTLFDAQAIGLVVVASDHADIPFVVSDAAYLFGEGDVEAATRTLRLAARTADEWSDRSERGRRHIEAQHGRESVAAGLGGIYAEAASLRR